MAQTVNIEVQVPFHVFVYPAPDLPEQWIAHCLELDVVTQGNSETHAREMMVDAIRTLIEYNLQNGLVPIQIRMAPREDWEAAGVPMPDAVEVKVTFKATADPSTRPYFEGPYPAFETIVADRAPATA